MLAIPRGWLQVGRERAAAAAEVERYRGDGPPLDVAGKRVVVVDDEAVTYLDEQADAEE